MLISSAIDINSTDIPLLPAFTWFLFHFFIIYYQIIFGIRFQYFIKLLYILHHKMVIPKFFHFYSHNQVSWSTTKPLQSKNHSWYLFLITSWYFYFQPFMELSVNNWLYSFNICVTKWSYRYCSTFAITAKY